MSTPQARIAARMRKRREDLRLSQKETAARLGVVLRTYARWERGETSGFMLELPRIAGVLSTTESDLLGGEDPLTAQPTVEELNAKMDNVLAEVRQLRADLLDLR